MSLGLNNSISRLATDHKTDFRIMGGMALSAGAIGLIASAIIFSSLITPQIAIGTMSSVKAGVSFLVIGIALEGVGVALILLSFKRKSERDEGSSSKSLKLTEKEEHLFSATSEKLSVKKSETKLQPKEKESSSAESSSSVESSSSSMKLAQQEKGLFSLMDLPEEVVYLILEQFTKDLSTNNLMACRRVSTGLKRIAEDPKLWEKIFSALYDFRRLEGESYLDAILREGLAKYNLFNLGKVPSKTNKLILSSDQINDKSFFERNGVHHLVLKNYFVQVFYSHLSGYLISILDMTTDLVINSKYFKIDSQNISGYLPSVVPFGNESHIAIAWGTCLRIIKVADGSLVKKIKIPDVAGSVFNFDDGRKLGLVSYGSYEEEALEIRVWDFGSDESGSLAPLKKKKINFIIKNEEGINVLRVYIVNDFLMVVCGEGSKSYIKIWSLFNPQDVLKKIDIDEIPIITSEGGFFFLINGNNTYVYSLKDFSQVSKISRSYAGWFPLRVVKNRYMISCNESKILIWDLIKNKKKKIIHIKQKSKYHPIQLVIRGSLLMAFTTNLETVYSIDLVKGKIKEVKEKPLPSQHKTILYSSSHLVSKKCYPENKKQIENEIETWDLSAEYDS